MIEERIHIKENNIKSKNIKEILPLIHTPSGKAFYAQLHFSVGDGSAKTELHIQPQGDFDFEPALTVNEIFMPFKKFNDF